MDILEEMVGTLTSGEVKEFRVRLKERKQHRLQELFDNTLGEGSAADLSGNAGHQLRFRLLRLVEEFICQKNSHPQEELVGIENYLIVAQYFFERGKNVLAWKYLKKAEDEATEMKQYAVLDRIYHTQIEHAHLREIPDNNDIIARWEKNQEAILADRRLNISLSMVRCRVLINQTAQIQPDLDQITEEIQQQFGSGSAGLDDVIYQTKVGIMMFELLKTQGKFLNGAEYLEGIFNKLETLPRYKKQYGKERAELLSLIAESMVKAMEFKACDHYLDLLDEQLIAINAGYIRRLKSHFMRYICHSRLGRNKEAGELLTRLEQDKNRPRGKEINYYYFFCINGNRCSYHLSREEPQESLKYLGRMLDQEKKILKTRGLAAVVFTHLNEIILRIEIGEHRKLKDVGYLQSRITSIEKRFRSFMNDPKNEAIKCFYNLLKHIIQNPDYIQTEAGTAAAWNYLGIRNPQIFHADNLQTKVWVIRQLTGLSFLASEEIENEYVEKATQMIAGV